MTNELKNRLSKVMTLGNRLAPRLGRHDAFIQAWSIVKAGSLVLPVRGVAFGNRQEALRRLAAYNPSDVRVFITPEPGNPVDRNAVAVMVGVQNGKGLYRLGYVPRELAPVAAVLGAQLPGLRLVEGTSRGARVALRV
jgi:hypothetical protein